VVLVDFFPPGDGIDGVFFDTDLLAAEAFPFYGVPSFFPADLLGVYFKILSTCFLTSPDSADFFPPLAFPFEAAFFFPLAPPLTLAAAGCDSASLSFFNASFPFSWMKMS
jgi:hypothetical protein